MTRDLAEVNEASSGVAEGISSSANRSIDSPGNALAQGNGEVKSGKPEKSKLVEGLLELGRNWAVAVAVTAFGAASYHGEGVVGIWQNRSLMLFVTIGFSLVWIAIAVLRFADVVQMPVKGLWRSALSLSVMAFLLFFGMGLVLQAASYADNAMFVRICSDYRMWPESAAHKDHRCQALYESRAQKERSYLGTQDDPKNAQSE
jgi:hypothetical protein